MHVWTVGTPMKAEHGVIFQCFYWPFHLKVMSFKPERSSSKEKVTQKPDSSLCLLPALWEVKCAPCYSSPCTFSAEPQEGILMVQYVVLNRKMNSLALWTHCQKAEAFLYCQKKYTSGIHATTNLTKPQLCAREPTPQDLSHWCWVISCPMTDPEGSTAPSWTIPPAAGLINNEILATKATILCPHRSQGCN